MSSRKEYLLQKGLQIKHLNEEAMKNTSIPAKNSQQVRYYIDIVYIRDAIKNIYIR